MSSCCGWGQFDFSVLVWVQRSEVWWGQGTMVVFKNIPMTQGWDGESNSVLPRPLFGWLTHHPTSYLLIWSFFLHLDVACFGRITTTCLHPVRHIWHIKVFFTCSHVRTLQSFSREASLPPTVFRQTFKMSSLISTFILPPYCFIISPSDNVQTERGIIPLSLLLPAVYFLCCEDLFLFFLLWLPLLLSFICLFPILIPPSLSHSIASSELDPKSERGNDNENRRWRVMW